MPNKASQKLRKRLKAADKRRSSRPQTSPPSPAPKQETVDVLGLLVEVTLDFSASHADLTDVAVVAALRGLQTGIAPRGEHSGPLFTSFAGVADRDDVSDRQLRNAAKQLHELAAKHKPAERADAKDSTAFLKYLELLV